MSHGGRTRTYLVHVPASYSRLRPVPLVIDIHGYTSSASAQKGVSGFLQKSDQMGLIVVWPQGYSDSWNAYGCCGSAQSSGVDDAGFIRAVAAEMSTKANIDHRRVYVTGISNGGSMSHKLSCLASDVFAAVAPVSFPLNVSASQCAPTQPVAVVQFHGFDDTTVPYNGGGLLGFQSAQTSFNNRRTVAQCTGTPTTLDLAGDDMCQTYTSCASGAHVALCSLSGTHVLYNTQSTLNIASYVWDSEMSHHVKSLSDQDGDGVADQDDNCPTVANPDQADSDGSCVGNVCEGGGSTPPPASGGTCTAGNTGWLNPSAQAADSGGDGNGFESNPTGAFADEGGSAANMDGSGDQHRFYNYGVSIQSGCSVKGIEVRLDWKVDSTLYTSSMSVQLSGDAGASWTSAKTDSTERTAFHTGVLGSTTDLWGATFTPGSVGDSSFRVRVRSTSSTSSRDFWLDWVPVRVTYGP